MRLGREFFEQPTLSVARGLLGKLLRRKINGKTITGTISETEAYCGTNDQACHSAPRPGSGQAARRTARTEVMFGPAGHAYVYFVYGMHWCFNIVTRKEGEPEAVLVRAVTLADGTFISGPARVARHFKIDGSLYGEDLVKSKRLWLEDSPRKIKLGKIVRTARIGVAYAGAHASLPWRFIIKDLSVILPK